MRNRTAGAAAQQQGPAGAAAHGQKLEQATKASKTHAECDPCDAGIEPPVCRATAAGQVKHWSPLGYYQYSKSPTNQALRMAAWLAFLVLFHHSSQ